MHFLNKDEVGGRYLTRPRAAATVRLEGREKLILCAADEVDSAIFVVGHDEQVCKLPERMKVVSPDGKAVKPSKGKAFYVTLRSFNPFHGVLELGPDDF